MALFAASDIQARMSASAYSRLYAKNGGGAVDPAFVAMIVAEAESEVKMITDAAFPGGFEASGGTVDVRIVGACVDIANEIAASRHPAASENSGYFLAGSRARKFFERMCADKNARPVAAGTGRALPLPEVLTDETIDVWNQARDGTDSSGF